MNRDAHQIYETYTKTAANRQLIEEGMFDRLMARGAQAVGAVKGAGQRIAGGAQQAAGKAIGKVAGAIGGGEAAKQAAQNIQKTGKSKIESGKMAGDIAKYQSIIKRTVANTVNDLKKMNIPVKDENALTQQLTAAVTGQLTNVSKTGQFRGQSGRLGQKVT